MSHRTKANEHKKTFWIYIIVLFNENFKTTKPCWYLFLKSNHYNYGLYYLKTYPHKVSGNIHLPAEECFIAFFFSAFPSLKMIIYKGLYGIEKIFHTNKYLKNIYMQSFDFFISSIQYKLWKQIIIFNLSTRLPVVLNDRRY